jgi:hypothetical protein
MSSHVMKFIIWAVFIHFTVYGNVITFRIGLFLITECKFMHYLSNKRTDIVYDFFFITFVKEVLLTGFDKSDVSLLAPLYKSLWTHQQYKQK